MKNKNILNQVNLICWPVAWKTISETMLN